MQTRHKVIAITVPAHPTIGIALLAVLMLATPLILFAIGCAKNSVFLVDGSGALFGMDITLLLWLRDQWNIAPKQHPIAIEARAVEVQSDSLNRR